MPIILLMWFIGKSNFGLIIKNSFILNFVIPKQPIPHIFKNNFNTKIHTLEKKFCILLKFLLSLNSKVMSFFHAWIWEMYTAQHYRGGCALLINKESTRSLLNLFEMRNTSCAQQYEGERALLNKEWTR